ncbi:uncharacterized protein BJX67DRAFT_45316 [Aspergillus lucknowensis]|uniref:Uncharacterized protein n=1 Tax=Aspergillus lucknowensis TaxID=176173 RepID=A0ABR4LVQ3_9EURO
MQSPGLCSHGLRTPPVSGLCIKARGRTGVSLKVFDKSSQYASPPTPSRTLEVQHVGGLTTRSLQLGGCIGYIVEGGYTLSPMLNPISLWFGSYICFILTAAKFDSPFRGPSPYIRAILPPKVCGVLSRVCRFQSRIKDEEGQPIKLTGPSS